MTNKRISDLSVGERFVYRNLDDADDGCVAELRAGGQSGGCDHDLYVAYMGEVTDAHDDLPRVVTDNAEAEESEISP